MLLWLLLFTSVWAAPAPIAPKTKTCNYNTYSQQRHEPFSSGKRNLPFQRPEDDCRTYAVNEVEEAISIYREKVKDPDLFRLFENSFPNTLDTAVKWTGYAKADDGTLTDEELAFIITGDIDAMWLRDSANQVLSYQPLLRASSDEGSLAWLFRGVINAHSRYIKIEPYCHAFQPPLEAQNEISPARNGAYSQNKLKHAYNQTMTFDCKWELDSLASFLQLSVTYFNATGDMSPFQRPSYLETIQVILDAVEGMRSSTYTEDGKVADSPYTFAGWTNRATETHSNDGIGNPTQRGTGMIRSFFRPSDDACIFQFLIPSNLLFASYLSQTSYILSQLPPSDVIVGTIDWMRNMSASVYQGVQTHGIITHPKYGQIYAYEVDGYGSANLMDDANLPSLLSIPMYSNISIYDLVYQNTRAFALSQDNPYWMWGPKISAVGGPHNGPGRAWPLASIVRILTSDDDEEVESELEMLLSTTDGLGLIHESVNTFDDGRWSRQWFSWANGMFGQMVLWLDSCRPGILGRSFQ